MSTKVIRSDIVGPDSRLQLSDRDLTYLKAFENSLSARQSVLEKHDKVMARLDDAWCALAAQQKR